MSQIVDIIFQAPFSSGGIRIFRENFSGDDLIRISLSLYQNSTIIVGNLTFTKVIKYTVIASEVDRHCVHQVMPCIGTIGENPLIIDLSAVAGDTDINVAAFVCSFSGQFRNHAVMTDTDSQLGSSRSVAHRHAQISGIPWFDRIPWKQFSVFQTNFSVRINDDCSIIRIL